MLTSHVQFRQTVDTENKILDGHSMAIWVEDKAPSIQTILGFKTHGRGWTGFLKLPHRAVVDGIRLLNHLWPWVQRSFSTFQDRQSVSFSSKYRSEHQSINNEGCTLFFPFSLFYLKH